MIWPVRAIVAVAAMLLTSGCISYDPPPAARSQPPARAGTTPTPAPSHSRDSAPTASPSPDSASPVMEWVKLTPEQFNPRCERTYSAVLTVTAKVTDPDTPLAELTVNAAWSAGTRTGDVRLAYRPGAGAFAAELPRISAEEAAAPNRPPQVTVTVSDPRRSGPPPVAFASVPNVCLVLGPAPAG